jgi:hypothetical protein
MMLFKLKIQLETNSLGVGQMEITLLLELNLIVSHSLLQRQMVMTNLMKHQEIPVKKHKLFQNKD